MRFIKQYIEKVVQNQRGSALAFTLIIFSVVFILSMSVISIFSSNLRQTKSQEHSMEAYYLSYSGALMGYSALTQATGTEKSLLTQIYEGSKYGDDGIVKEEKKIPLGKGTVDVKAIKFENDPYKDWIKVTSTSNLTQENVSSTTILYIDPLNPNNIKWNEF